MDKHLEQIIENARARAKQIMDSTSAVRDSFAVGRPNSSKESTVQGTLKAFRTMVSKFTPPGYTKRAT